MATTELTVLQELTQRIDALEARNAFQDDVIEQLNSELTIHQSAIAELKENMKTIALRLKESATGNDGKVEVEPPPPHY